MNVEALKERVKHRCGQHKMELPADEACVLIGEVERLEALVVKLRGPKVLTPQPSPVQGGVVVWERVIERVRLVPPVMDGGLAEDAAREALIADMQARHEQGVAKYGQPLCTNDGRDSFIDAYQEALDLCAYTTKLAVEGKVDWDLVDIAVQFAFGLRAEIH